MKVFILVNEWANDYESDVSTYVFSTKEKAKAEMEKTIKEFLEDDDLAKAENCEIEKSEDSFLAYEDGYYLNNHFSVSIQEKIVL